MLKNLIVDFENLVLKRISVFVLIKKGVKMLNLAILEVKIEMFYHIIAYRTHLSHIFYY